MFYLVEMNDWFVMFSTILELVAELNRNSAEILLVSLFNPIVQSHHIINSIIEIITKRMLINKHTQRNIL